MQEQLIGGIRRALAAALIAAAIPAHALVLGEIEVRSMLGEALDARIALEQADSQVVDASCFALARAAAGDLPAIREGILTIERTGSSMALRVRSLGGMYEPAMALRVRAACPGDAGAVLRQYTILLDPRPGTQVVPAPPVLERGLPGSATELRVEATDAATGNAAGSIANLRARPGDSLRSIAAAVFPRNRQAQSQYLAALREANPAIAAHAGNEALPEGTVIALPDLRTYARAAIDASRAAPQRVRGEPAEAKPARETRAKPAGEAPARNTAAPRAVAPASSGTAASTPSGNRATAASGSRSGDTFVLKLSSSEVDLSRTRAVDERVRSQLRERLLVLDSDDQVAALLAMRNSLRQLESRVNELQLKLAAMPPSLATARPAEPPPVVTPAPAPPAASTTATAPLTAPPAIESRPGDAPLPTSAPPASAAAPPASAAAPPASVAAPPASVAAQAPTAAVPEAPARSRPTPRQPSRFDLSPWLWGLVALLTALALLLAWSLRRRRSHDEEVYEYEDERTVTAEPSIEADRLGELAQEDLRATIESDASLPTRLADDSSQLRRRYFEERFPEIGNRTIALEQPESVVKGARLFYEDGAPGRAIELLEFALEENPGEVRLWLALFEILRLEGKAEAFAALATRFRARHEKSGYWLKVQYIGRELDPGNALYRDETFSKLETIGPSSARRLAAATYDPVAENWLNAPMDFQNQVLASEMRRALMTHAAVVEQDLVPNPMPALRNVEMFTLA